MHSYLDEIDEIKVNKKGAVISLHKPIVLLLTIADILHGKPNEFHYDELKPHIVEFLRKYGLKNITSNPKPHYPFVYLGSSPKLWKSSVDRDSLRHPDAASESEVKGAIAHFPEGFLNFIKDGRNGRIAIHHLLQSYWPEAYHDDILHDLGIQEQIAVEDQKQKLRGRLFVEEVLDAYERKCAICDQAIRLGDTLIGIDACHVKPIQHFGPDHVTNGLALCKLHHWALDRGAISVDLQRKVILSTKLNGQRMQDFIAAYADKQIFIPRQRAQELDDKNLNYHYEYIFIK